PAQSPTLSPTLSAMVAALRGSSSGMFCSTLPTRSAPTSAALVKIPPPTRMNIATMAAPKPKPSRTSDASLRNSSTTAPAPSRPKPIVAIPTQAPVRTAMIMAGSRPAPRAAAATRRLARTASHLPRYPLRAPNPAPTRNATDREQRSSRSRHGGSPPPRPGHAAAPAPRRDRGGAEEGDRPGDAPEGLWQPGIRVDGGRAEQQEGDHGAVTEGAEPAAEVGDGAVVDLPRDRGDARGAS